MTRCSFWRHAGSAWEVHAVLDAPALPRHLPVDHVLTFEGLQFQAVVE